MFYRVMPKCTLNGRGLSSRGYVSWMPLLLLPGNVAGTPPTGNVPVRGWHRLVTQEPDYPLTAEPHSVQHTGATLQR